MCSVPVSLECRDLHPGLARDELDQMHHRRIGRRVLLHPLLGNDEIHFRQVDEIRLVGAHGMVLRGLRSCAHRLGRVEPDLGHAVVGGLAVAVARGNCVALNVVAEPR